MSARPPLGEANARLVRRLLVTVVAMFGFGFALVPLYDVLCEVTGFNGRTGVVDASVAGEPIDYARTITVEFLGTTNSDLPWEFRPLVKRVRVHPGEIGEVSFFARNEGGAAMVGQAVPSVSPTRGALYFNKTECFCFTRQRFAPGEEREMPVRFVVDASLPAEISTLTLSYTFFNVTDKS